ncbi:unnamed protein product [Triticum turgidum subsp. durum]|uniref:F-box domain-containing protein n=1 Tax=Triticum turgidum subsp. durum TaxID=4567 RepID=A0A9R1RXS9_TRITD|nr:unnamed protein product [Triticum turgidum subsp. durum]
MPPPPARRTLGGNASAPLTSLPDDLVEEIFLRLPTATDLARASMACASFRRIIAGHFFLRRFRALHRPPLVGVLAYDSAERKSLSVAFLPAQPPHPSAAAAALTLAAADFSCSFLPSPELWSTRDFRDGRALLSKQGDSLANLAVCDPLHRRYLLLPAIPHDLAVLARQLKLMHCGPFLAPAGENEGDSANAPSGFRVMCLRMSSTKLVLFVFYSSGARAGQWHTVTFDGWSALIARYVSACFFPGTVPLPIRRHYAHGCFYWEIPYTRKLLVLDTLMEFSSLSPLLGRYQRVFVEAREGRLGMISHGINGDRLLYDILRDNEDGTKQWQMEDVIPVPHYYGLISDQHTSTCRAQQLCRGQLAAAAP